MIFYMLRHGLTNDDMPGREKVTGWLDVPLNAQGRVNAAKAGQFLKRKGISHIVTSDALRAIQTANIVADICCLKVVESEKLCSWNMGHIQGMDIEAAKPFLTYFEKHPALRPPEGEPFNAFYNRFKGAFYGMVSYVRRFPNSTPLFVTHSQNMDIAKWFIKGIEPGELIQFGEGIKPGGVMEVSISMDGKISLRELKVN
jgi:broad specificity phosphatase PhoE